MQIGIVGSGNVGGTLGKRWARLGHEVVFGSRNPASDEIKALLADAGDKASARTNAEAAQCDVVLLATPWPATKQILGALDLRGRILIDATNPLLPDFSALEFGTTTSGGEQVALWAPGAKLVKAFNSVGFNIMADPNINGQPASLLYCGDDADAKAIVHQLASALGFDPIDAGPFRQARLLEPLAMLWVSLAFTPGHGREFAFRAIYRDGRR